MGVHQKKIPVQELTIGMFVSDLDRPWHQTPFPIQGFYVKTDDEIRALTSYCKAVYVDVAEKQSSAESSLATFGARGRREAEKSLKLPPIQVRNPRQYEIVNPIQRELKPAEKVLTEVQESLAKLYGQARAGATLTPKVVEKAAEGMVNSILRNPDALLWLTRVRLRDEHTYTHSMNTAVWALVFGRQLGFQPDILRQLGAGALLSQVGKAQLPANLFKPETEMTSDELKLYRGYPETGARMLDAAGMPPAVVGLVRHHRERHNGNGFPQGLTGEKIPLLAKVASLADHYQALVEPRGDIAPLMPAQAVGRLYEARNSEFQEDLVERFIQAVGVYPTGTIVTLSDNRVGVVLSHRPNRRLWPKIMLMTDQERQPLKAGKVIDMAEYNEGRSNGEALQIAGCLPYDTAGVDPSEYGVSESSPSRWNWRKLVG
ncbi:HD-GYP domain-containing protein [Hydrocarboniclastica marina]|uniref:HD-GYP domain-containing protein n=1 Tax=Hydrocarboniclastica marina TaxID=2259620 RepID=A0A4P7XFY1_9ALTE|nr:HD domain-containing phosphohydrolase [Hydrocarboniclastica marina]MAL98391.1 phosphohydrolase [Alteromonadaceae bacterium]QCF25846.1 HD-GYP domain-containing protein [Hydrocarboniclastica marina]